MKTIILTFMSFVTVVQASQFDVRQFRAVGDGKTPDTTAIQKAVDTAAAAGGGTVLIPAGKFLTGPFTLASGINLHLAASAVILIDNDLSRYPVIKKRYQDAITVTGARDVEITGEGTIDGQGEVWWQAFRANRP